MERRQFVQMPFHKLVTVVFVFVVRSHALKIAVNVENINEDDAHSLNVGFHLDDEEHHSQSYAGTLLRFWSNETHCLNFMHIPKTAGSSIEAVGAHSNKQWGINNALPCSTMQKCPSGFPWGSHKQCCQMPDHSLCSVWHVPPVTDEVLQQSYAKCDTFCVVRDPLSRFRSQHVWSGGECTSNALTEATQTKLEELKTHMYQDDCHLVPQIQFVEGENAALCQHKLKLENLDKDFETLMKQFAITAKMTVHRNPASCAAAFDERSKAALRQFYAADYDAFGYS